MDGCFRGVRQIIAGSTLGNRTTVKSPGKKWGNSEDPLENSNTTSLKNDLKGEMGLSDSA